MQATQHLGQRDGRAFIRVSSMFPLSGRWSDHVIYVDLYSSPALAFRPSGFTVPDIA